MHDQEAALNDLCKEVAKSSNGDVLQQSPPVGESQANGRIEVAVKLSKNQVRAIKFGLEKRLRCRIPQDHPIMGFLAELDGLLAAVLAEQSPVAGLTVVPADLVLRNEQAGMLDDESHDGMILWDPALEASLEAELHGPRLVLDLLDRDFNPSIGLRFPNGRALLDDLALALLCDLLA